MNSDTPFSRLKLIPRSAQVREQLDQAIRRGDYKAGERLPSERELSELFGVSRVSIREAIRSLEAVGLVEVRHGAGMMVTDPSQRMTRDLSRWMKVNRGELLELLTVRGALDEVAGAEAAQRRQPKAIASIGKANEAFAQAVADGADDRLVALDMAFHLAIAAASGNELLHNLLAELHNHLAETRSIFFTRPARKRASAREHAAILAAIERGDEAAVRRATKRHIASVRKLLQD